jgi:chitin synthase
VLPGAFSAYRWDAIDGKPLWKEYFYSLKYPHELTCFNANVYLAEDRVLCLNIVASEGKKYHLRYVKSSTAETDVPDTFLKFLG